MASIFKIKSGKNQGKWKGVVYLPPKPGETKRRRKEFYGNSKAEVAAQVTEYEYKINHNLYVDPGNTTLRDYLKEWIRVYCEESDGAPTTKALYKMYIEKHIAPENDEEFNLGNIALKDLLPIHIQDYINYKMQSLKGKTVNKLITVLNKALKDAVNNRLILFNPCDSVKRPKKEKFKPTIYTEKQVFELIDKVKGTFDEVCIVLASYVGLRRGEIFGLRWKDIDFNAHTITIEETITRFDKYVVKGPKSESGARTIIAPAFVFDVLREYKKSLGYIPKNDDRVCDKYKPQAYSEHFKKLLIKNNLPIIRLHDLRHYNATIMMKYHVPDTIAAAQLGHADPRTTKIYQHAQNDSQKLAAEILNQVFMKSREI